MRSRSASSNSDEPASAMSAPPPPGRSVASPPLSPRRLTDARLIPPAQHDPAPGIAQQLLLLPALVPAVPCGAELIVRIGDVPGRNHMWWRRACMRSIPPAASSPRSSAAPAPSGLMPSLIPRELIRRARNRRRLEPVTEAGRPPPVTEPCADMRLELSLRRLMLPAITPPLRPIVERRA